MNDIPNGKNLNDLSNTFSEMKKKPKDFTWVD